MRPLLQARDLRVRLGGKRVLDGVDLELRPASITAVLGENGSGKSTLIRALAGLLKVESGSIHVQDDPLDSLRRLERARRMACTLQDAPLAFDFELIDVVRMGVAPDVPPRVRDERVRGALEALEIVGLAHEPWGRLSGGERQRAHLARLLASRARVLMLDEPQNHLDLASRITLRSALTEEAKRGAGVLFSTHDLEEACWADVVLVLQDGGIVAVGAPDLTLTTALIERVFRVRARSLVDPLGGPPAFRFGPLTSLESSGSAPDVLSPDSKKRTPSPCPSPST